MCQKSEEQESSLDGLIFLSYYLAKWIIQENIKYYDDILNRY